jgi:hypothetical protein
MGKRLNCWDFMRCGFGPGGSNSGPDQVCPAAMENNLDEIHGGIEVAGPAGWSLTRLIVEKGRRVTMSRNTTPV